MMTTISHDNRVLFAKAIAEFCERLEAAGNQGEYSSGWFLAPKYKSLRDGIVFFSTGWGWRARKKPYWRDVWNDRFSADLTAYQAAIEARRNDIAKLRGQDTE